MVNISRSGKKDPQLQTNEEWLADHNGENPRPTADIHSQVLSRDEAMIVGFPTKNSKLTPNIFTFLDFRTTRNKSVAMDFISIDLSIKATCFLSVKLVNNRGRKYRTGTRGQFVPPKNGKFRIFWMSVVGEEPRRWCRVHKSMHSKLRGKYFTGRISKEIDSKGNPYFKLTELKLIEKAQIEHK